MPVRPKPLTYRAAGGVVLDDAGRVLLLERTLQRNNAFSHEIRLPKGHIEPGETAKQAALREVCEESGFCELHIVADLGRSVVEFEFQNQHVRRQERYFLMRLRSAARQPPRPKSPDAEEALFQPLWVADLAAAEKLLTFESEKGFVRRAQAIPL